MADFILKKRLEDCNIELSIYGERHNRKDVPTNNLYQRINLKNKNTIFIVEHSDIFEEVGELEIIEGMSTKERKEFLNNLNYGSDFIFYKAAMNNNLDNVFCLDNRMSMGGLGRRELNEIQDFIQKNPFNPETMSVYRKISQRLMECLQIFISKLEEYREYNPEVPIHVENYVKIIGAIKNNFTKLSSLSKSSMSKDDIFENMRRLLLYILNDCEGLGSLSIDLNMIDFINKVCKAKKHATKISIDKISLFAGNSHAIRIADYYEMIDASFVEKHRLLVALATPLTYEEKITPESNSSSKSS